MTAKNKKKIISRLKKPYRLVIVNDNNLEERASFTLTPVNIILLFSLLFLMFFAISYFILQKSKVGNYITSGSGTGEHAELVLIKNKLDLIERKNLQSIRRNRDIAKVLKGERIVLDTQNLDINETKVAEADISFSTDTINLNDFNAPSTLSTESIGARVAEMDYNFESQLFFTPLSGEISQSYDAISHQAIDVTPINKNSSIKAVLDGTVVSTGWTYNFGHVIHLQHTNNLISIYKHNSFLHKKIGDYVKAGEVIAVVGNSGELTSGTHLHFELWYNGRSLDPSKFINF
jgi:murein DD-endopeptidase MepM/ murein hydrolase activator NlpD